MNMLLSGGLESYLEVFEYYFSKFATNDIKPIVWIEFITVITIGFIARWYLWQKVEADKVITADNNIKRKVKIYCLNHTAYEFIIGFIATFVLINFTGANPHAFVVNAGICPGSGFMIGMLFDRKIIMKLEPSNDLDNNYQPQEVNYEADVQKQIIEEKIDDIEDEEGLNKIDLNTVESCDAKLAYKIVSTINEVIDESEFHSEKIMEIGDKIELLERIISILKDTEKNDKKLELKSLIYKCLNNGFATPEEDTIITNKYNSYMALADNDSEIKSLFENRYLKLNIHEDRRKEDIPVENDRRRGREIKYGEFDNEVPEG
jgi:hypothetical protein